MKKRCAQRRNIKKRHRQPEEEKEIKIVKYYSS